MNVRFPFGRGLIMRAILEEITISLITDNNSYCRFFYRDVVPNHLYALYTSALRNQ